MTDYKYGKSRLRLLLMLPIFLFLIVFLLAFILKNSSQPTHSFLWSVKTFQGFCVNQASDNPTNQRNQLKICKVSNQYSVQNNLLIQTKAQNMYQEDLYFYDLASHENRPISFLQAQQLNFLNLKNSPQGFKLVYALPFSSSPFPFDFYPALRYASSMTTFYPIALEKNGWQLKIQTQPFLTMTTGTWGPSDSLKLLGWVQA